MESYPWLSEVYKRYPPRGISSNGNDIIENPDTSPILIGHTLQWCNELEKSYDEAIKLGLQHKKEKEEYFEELVKAGLKHKSKTTEDMLLEAMNAIKYLANRIERLEDANGYQSDCGNGNRSIETNKPDRSKKIPAKPTDSTASDTGIC